ncbi:hypothetical protein ACTFIU_007127 [Dictyostelium citrinum]
MDHHKQLTLQTTLESCYNLYNLLFDSIGSIKSSTQTSPLPQQQQIQKNNINTNSVTPPTTTSSNANINSEEIFQLNKFHLYGENNIDELYNSIELKLQTIKFTCQQYRQWDSTERDSFKFFNTQKLYNQSQQRGNLVSKTLFDCSLLGKIYLNQQRQQQEQQQQQKKNQQQKQKQQQTIEDLSTLTIASKNISKTVEVKRKLGLLAGKLQEMTNELNNKYSTFSVLDDLLGLLKSSTEVDYNSDSYVSCNISSSTFLLDIDIYHNGEIKEVKLVHILTTTGEVEPAEQQFNDELTNSLKTDMKEFIKKVQRICDLDLLFRKYKHFDLQKAFSILQSDFLNISINSNNSNYSSNSSRNNKEIEMNKGFGEIKLDCCGVLIKYFQSYIDRISKMNEPYSIMIEMESSAVTNNGSLIEQSEYSRLSLKSLLQQQQQTQPSTQTESEQPPIATQQLTSIEFSENDCFDSEPLSSMLESDSIFSPVRLVCKLNKPILITNQQLTKILNLSKIHRSHSSQQQQSQQPQQQQQQQKKLNSVDESMNENGDSSTIESNNVLIKKYSIQNLLISSSSPSNSNSNNSNNNNNNSINIDSSFDSEVYGMKQRYYYTGEFELGIEISRIPIYHPSQVYPTIQLLRQQIVFNILFKSCFQNLNISSSHNIIDSCNNGNNDAKIFEITSNPPNSINIIFLHPINNNFNSIDIFINNNGDLEAWYYDNTTNNQPNIQKSTLFTKMLIKSLSISVSLACFFKNK